MALLVCIPYLSYTTLIILMLSGLLTFFYATPLLSLGKSNFNLRKIWFLKSIIVALVWTLTCAVVPLLEYDASEYQMIWFSVEKFLFILGITIPYDIKDLEKDKQEISSLSEKEIIEVDVAQFPQVAHQPVQLVGVEIQRVFPDIPIFQMGIVADLLHVGGQREVAGVAAAQPAPYVEQRVLVRVHPGTKIDRA